MNTIIDKALCTGCTACYASCPVSCIMIDTDTDGFSYPVKGAGCIGCDKCTSICPRLNQNENRIDIHQRAFAVRTKKNAVWRNSTSGGAFFEICNAWGQNGATWFAGAAWRGLNVQHICVGNLQNVVILSKSKYIQSELLDCFSEVKALLEHGNWLVFSGTPCQIAGLKAFLGKNYEKLLLVDLICHGVGSPKVFLKCKDIIEEQLQIKVKTYSFRHKDRVYDKDHINAVTTEDGRTLYLSTDPYLQLFISQSCLRKSCGENCIYRTKNRQGDITIGDFKGLTKVFPSKEGEKKNYSTLVVNTVKGELALKNLMNHTCCEECTIEDIEKYNPLFSHHTFFSLDREDFFEEFKCNPEKAILCRTSPAVLYKRTMKKRAFSMLPKSLRAYILRLERID